MFCLLKVFQTRLSCFPNWIWNPSASALFEDENGLTNFRLSMLYFGVNTGNLLITPHAAYTLLSTAHVLHGFFLDDMKHVKNFGLRFSVFIYDPLTLTHWPLENLNEILNMWFSNRYISDWWLRHLLWNCLIWMSVDFTDDQSTLVQVVVWGLVPSGNKPLPEPMLSKIFHHMASLGLNEFTLYWSMIVNEIFKHNFLYEFVLISIQFHQNLF